MSYSIKVLEIQWLLYFSIGNFFMIACEFSICKVNNEHELKYQHTNNIEDIVSFDKKRCAEKLDNHPEIRRACACKSEQVSYMCNSPRGVIKNMLTAFPVCFFFFRFVRINIFMNFFSDVRMHRRMTVTLMVIYDYLFFPL